MVRADRVGYGVECACGYRGARLVEAERVPDVGFEAGDDPGPPVGRVISSGDEAAEREWLTQARDAYRQSFELDGDISEESAMRVAYLIGELSLRLDEPIVGAQWLETAVRFPEAKRQTGLDRQARDRLSDARKLLAELDEAESA